MIVVRRAAPALLLALTLLPLFAAAQTDGEDDFLGRVTIDRAEGDVVIVNRGDFAAGARALPFIGGCEEGVRLLTYYGPERAVETTLDEATRVIASAVIVASPEEGEGDDDLAWYDAAVEFAEGRPCPEEIVAVDAPRVTLEQGRTTVRAAEMRLPAGSDVAELDGPVDLLRVAEGDAEDDVRAEAADATYDRGTERATLTGGVTVTSGERVSEADTLELDETAGTALLRGDPARSTQGGDVVEGDVLIYYLDSNAVEVVGRVRGTLQLP